MQCLKLQIAVASPDPQPRALPGTEFSRKFRSPKIEGWGRPTIGLVTRGDLRLLADHSLERGYRGARLRTAGRRSRKMSSPHLHTRRVLSLSAFFGTFRPEVTSIAIVRLRTLREPPFRSRVLFLSAAFLGGQPKSVKRGRSIVFLSSSGITPKQLTKNPLRPLGTRTSRTTYSQAESTN